ncbi:helix-turn-helix transcriptional regulator [Stutzerimonas stutzeri]|jgi:prophage regulatory protein|uniref:helix-turn-helix transcriptional regulator n=1 Tax=Stutzerimonas stutzeri TaxID=316 RepID=UPI000396311E|nr:AlpA family phage regulatory protein [Stutzerimonas stutzeri]EQM79629.1 excisionase [Stutzerimonas stutzeri MF28]
MSAIVTEPTNRLKRAERRIYRLQQVMDATGFGRAWIYELMKRGDFPQAHKIGTRAVGWDSRQVEAWVATQLGEEV